MQVRVLMPALVAIALTAPVVAAADLVPCEDSTPNQRVDCGRIAVLEDRSRPDGRVLELHVRVLRSETPGDRTPVFLLAGGPGLGATELEGIATGPYADVRRLRDIVLVDQRGTGQSNPLLCPVDLHADPARAFGALWDPEHIAACRRQAATHADPTLYGTLQVVADLEEVRQQLGYERVILWGASGGTRTALVWLREFPASVEAIAIDGVAPTSFRAPSGYARGCQQALERVFADCEAQPDCQEAYPQLRADFARLLRLFASGPVRTTVAVSGDRRVPVSMHAGDLAYAIRGILYSSAAIRDLPTWIHEAARSQDPSRFAQRYWERAVGLEPVIALGVHWSVFCTEDVPFIEAERIPELTRGTFVGTYLIDQYKAACEAWGGGTVPASFHDPVRSDVPALILSGWYDPSTPAEVAQEAARFLPNSRHIVVRNEAHGAGFDCARQAVVDFLRTASLEGLGPVCEDVGPIRFNVR